MPRKRKPKPTLLEQYAEARKSLEEAQSRVAHLEHAIEPLRQMLIAELAGTGEPLEPLETPHGTLHHIMRRRQNGGLESEAG